MDVPNILDHQTIYAYHQGVTFTFYAMEKELALMTANQPFNALKMSGIMF